MESFIDGQNERSLKSTDNGCAVSARFWRNSMAKAKTYPNNIGDLTKNMKGLGEAILNPDPSGFRQFMLGRAERYNLPELGDNPSSEEQAAYQAVAERRLEAANPTVACAVTGEPIRLSAAFVWTPGWQHSHAIDLVDEEGNSITKFVVARMASVDSPVRRDGGFVQSFRDWVMAVRKAAARVVELDTAYKAGELRLINTDQLATLNLESLRITRKDDEEMSVVNGVEPEVLDIWRAHIYRYQLADKASNKLIEAVREKYFRAEDQRHGFGKSRGWLASYYNRVRTVNEFDERLASQGQSSAESWLLESLIGRRALEENSTLTDALDLLENNREHMAWLAGTAEWPAYQSAMKEFLAGVMDKAPESIDRWTSPSLNGQPFCVKVKSGYNQPAQRITFEHAVFGTAFDAQCFARCQYNAWLEEQEEVRSRVGTRYQPKIRSASHYQAMNVRPILSHQSWCKEEEATIRKAEEDHRRLAEADSESYLAKRTKGKNKKGYKGDGNDRPETKPTRIDKDGAGSWDF